MARKRASTSQNPKTKKRNKPQQTETVKKPTKNEEKVQLDYLVVEKIASLTKVKFAPDVCQELVSPAFANALRSFYSEKKLTLSFRIDYENSDDDSEYPNVLLLSISGLSQRSKEEIKVHEDNLSRAMQQIFARFRRIQLKTEVIDIKDVACFLSDALNSVRDVTIETLDITFDYFILVQCHTLIKKLSRNLRVLNLHIFDPRKQYKSKKFWQTVASCTKLDRLSVEFDYDQNAEKYGYLETSDAVLAHISDCLKLMKIKHFRTNLQEGEEKERTMEWLPRAFANNESLRQLDIDTYFESGCYLGDLVNAEDGPLFLSRLESLKIKIGDRAEYRIDWVSSFEKILPAMSDQAILKICVEYCKEDVGNILQMYLELSHRTARRIKLLFLFRKDDVNAIANFERALHQLPSVKEFRGLKTVPEGACTRVLFGSADLMVKIQWKCVRNHAYDVVLWSGSPPRE